jgi:hypothetical protein
LAIGFPAVERSKSLVLRLGKEIQEASYNSFGYCLHRLVVQIQDDPLLNPMLAILEGRDAAQIDGLKKSHKGSVLLPVDELNRLAALWSFTKKASTRPEDTGWAVMVASEIGGIQETRQLLNLMILEVVVPVLNHLLKGFEASEKLISETWRYKRLMEWFRYREFAHLARNNWKEDPLDEDFRRFLMEAGYSYPFSQPVIPNARPDIVLVKGESDPLPIEVKVFDGKQRGIDYLRQGFGQAIDYARKYQAGFAVYLIFNVSDSGALEFLDAGPTCPSYSVQNQTVFLVPVQMVSLGAPSKSGGPKLVTVSLTDLVG